MSTEEMESPRKYAKFGSQVQDKDSVLGFQKHLYNQCRHCRKLQVEENLQAWKQKKYIEMLKHKKSDKKLKYPCAKCKYIASNPSNLKTHQMANHDGVDFVTNYVKDYLDKNKVLILWN